MPPTMSEWPLRYFVAECMTTSKPSSSGRWTQGVAKVLSQAARMPRLRAKVATASRSTSFSSGLVGRSEEHTSELQSLMRISYAVFCLKKKKTKTKHKHIDD